MTAEKILICDDHKAIHESLRPYLEAEGFKVISAYDGEEGLECFKKQQPALIVLDIMLPKLFGTEVCKEIRKTSEVPIIFLSARSEEMDRIIGLELGADDYVVKPFSPREVATRVKIILKRTGGKAGSPGKQIIKMGELYIDLDAYEVRAKGSRIGDLTPKEIELVYYLAQYKGNVMSREQILNAVWGYDYYGDTRTVDNQIRRIRQKLPLDGTGVELRSIYGVGYKLEQG